MRWLDRIIDSMDMNLSNLREIVKDGEPGVLQSMRSQRVRCDLATEQQQHFCSSPSSVEDSLGWGKMEPWQKQ